MQLCAITDQRQLGNPLDLFAMLQGWAAGGVNFIQLREKHLDASQLRSLASTLTEIIGKNRSKLLVNISAQIPESELAALVLTAAADGVHLAGKPEPGAATRVRQAFRSNRRDAIVSVPCHSLEDIDVAREERADLILFSPVFEKQSEGRQVPPQGLGELHRACAAARGIPVFALGGVTSSNALDCLAAGAAGVAGIRLFAGDDWRRLPAN